MRIAGTLCLTALVVLAGCGAIGGGPSPTATAPDSATATPTESGTTTDPSATEPPSPEPPTGEPPSSATPTPVSSGSTLADPDEDVKGWEQGYWHNESIDVDNSDGLNDTEFEKVLARTIARVELIRDLELDKELEVQFVTRAELQANSPFRFGRNTWREQFWEAAFIVGENASTADELTALYDVVVDGYQYENQIVMVQANPDSPRIDPYVLAHEVSHAFDGVPREGGPEPPYSTDEIRALRSEEEGQASWVDTEYERLCDERWECIERPPDADRTPDEPVNMGLYLQFAAPYTLGQAFQEHQVGDGGIEASKHVQRYPPLSMEQVIHPGKYESDPPTTVTLEDRTGGDWERLTGRGDDGRDTFGEAILYSMLWKNGVIETDPVEVSVDQQTGLSYSHPATAGWDGDVVVAYTNGSAFGYVFKSTWDDTSNATEFREAYMEMLESKGATKVGENTWVIEEGPYADAFRVVQRGETLIVVNAPTVDALDEVHALEDN